jgi:hypothetical protein
VASCRCGCDVAVTWLATVAMPWTWRGCDVAGYCGCDVAVTWPCYCGHAVDVVTATWPCHGRGDACDTSPLHLHLLSLSPFTRQVLAHLKNDTLLLPALSLLVAISRHPAHISTLVREGGVPAVLAAILAHLRRGTLTAHLSPPTAHRPPLTSHLSPLTSHLSPLTSSHLFSLISPLSSLISHLPPHFPSPSACI